MADKSPGPCAVGSASGHTVQTAVRLHTPMNAPVLSDELLAFFGAGFWDLRAQTVL